MNFYGYVYKCIKDFIKDYTQIGTLHVYIIFVYLFSLYINLVSGDDVHYNVNAISILMRNIN